MKTAVIYKSKYGATETYAKWLAQDLNADLIRADKVNKTALSKYDNIVYGGGVYVGSVNGVSFFTKNYDVIKNKRLYLFSVGAAEVKAAETQQAIQSVLEQKLTKEILSNIKVYNFQGGMQYSKMTFLHKAMMSMIIKVISKKPENERQDREKGMIESYGKDIIKNDRTAIAGLVADVIS